jgi:hypothetical protein
MSLPLQTFALHKGFYWHKFILNFNYNQSFWFNDIFQGGKTDTGDGELEVFLYNMDHRTKIQFRRM